MLLHKLCLMMHNLCMNESDITTLALATAARARAQGITQSQIALAINADQSQVSRVLSGNTKRPSKVFNAVCNYVNKTASALDSSLIEQNQEILNAIACVWDGTEQHALALSNVIRSLGALIEITNKKPRE
jgi:transcriptional regulator with XRE-family HTH domain